MLRPFIAHIIQTQLFSWLLKLPTKPRFNILVKVTLSTAKALISASKASLNSSLVCKEQFITQLLKVFSPHGEARELQPVQRKQTANYNQFK